MKMIVYSCSAEERPLFARYAGQFGAELTLLAEKPVLENAHLAAGMDAVNILSATCITPEILDVYKTCGVRMVVSRTVGVEHVDTAYANSIGIAVGNAPTALLRMAERMEAGELRPALVIGVPVGFVNVVESKERIWAVCQQLGVPAIVAMGRKGGSTVAAAICNALLYQAAEMRK